MGVTGWKFMKNGGVIESGSVEVWGGGGVVVRKFLICISGGVLWKCSVFFKYNVVYSTMQIFVPLKICGMFKWFKYLPNIEI